MKRKKIQKGGSCTKFQGKGGHTDRCSKWCYNNVNAQNLNTNNIKISQDEKLTLILGSVLYEVAVQLVLKESALSLKDCMLLQW